MAAMTANQSVHDDVADNAAANLTEVERINAELLEFVERIRRATRYQRLDTVMHLHDLADTIQDAVGDYGELARQCAEADVRANPIR